MEEQTINLRVLFYKVLTGIRTIILWTLIVAVLAAGYGAYSILSVLWDSESYEKALSEYEVEYETWENTGKYYDQAIETTTAARTRLQDYIDNSVMMKIDPTQEYYGTLSYYVDAHYQIIPELTYQNIDYTTRVMGAYSRYMSYGEMLEQVLAETDQVSEMKYLKEILSAWTDSTTSTINVSVVGVTEADVREILNIVKAGIEEKYAEVNTGVAEHSLTLITESVYAQLNTSLSDTQENNQNAILRYSETIKEYLEAKEDWKKEESEPVFSYTYWGAVKSAIKYGIIGAVGGLVLIAVCYALYLILGSNIYDEEFLTGQGLVVLGKVSDPVKWKGLNNKAKSKLAKFLGLSRAEGTVAESGAFAGAAVAATAKTKGYAKVALVSDEEKAVAEEVVQALGNGIVYMGSLLKDAQAAEKLADYDCVVLLTAEHRTLKANAERELGMLATWGKPVLGAVVINN